MIWCIALTVLTIIFGAVGIIALVLFIVSMCDVPACGLVAIICIVLAFGCCVGTTEIEKANTTTQTQVVEMEITKCDMTSVKAASGMVRDNFYITAGNKYVIQVSAKDYAALNVGDVVSVEIETKTTFGETMETASLKVW